MAKVKKPKKEDLEEKQKGQGVGSLVNQTISNINHSNEAVTNSYSRG